MKTSLSDGDAIGQDVGNRHCLYSARPVISVKPECCRLTGKRVALVSDKGSKAWDVTWFTDLGDGCAQTINLLFYRIIGTVDDGQIDHCTTYQCYNFKFV